MDYFDFLTLNDEDTVKQPRPSLPAAGSVQGRPESARVLEAVAMLDELASAFDDFGASW